MNKRESERLVDTFAYLTVYRYLMKQEKYQDYPAYLEDFERTSNEINSLRERLAEAMIEE